MALSSNIFNENGIIAGGMPGYEMRPQQLQMAEATERAIESGAHLIVEAGTGIGKSLAYLIPFIYWAVRGNKKVAISTYTKTLQNQLFIKDLPFLAKNLDIKFSYALCMGSENYVCLRKLYRNQTGSLFSGKREKKQIEKILQWAEHTETGLKSDLDFVPAENLWKSFSREADMCRWQKCPNKENCFYYKNRQKQNESHILITNHSLLFSDMISESRVLPDYHGLVLDEAHTLADVATKHFGETFSNMGIKYIVENILKILPDDMRDLKKQAKKVLKVSDGFFKKVEEFYGKETKIEQFQSSQFSPEEIRDSLKELSFLLSAASRETEDEETAELIKTYAMRCHNFSEKIDFIFNGDTDEYVLWLDIKSMRREMIYSFHAEPVDISEKLKVFLFDRIAPIIMTSATLSSSSRARKDDFTFFKRNLGIERCDELSLGSPFDYSNNVLIYQPGGISDPNKDFENFKEQVSGQIVELYRIMGGRIFVLFTSYNMMNKVAEHFKEKHEDISILKQGDMPRYVLLDVFKRDRKSLLLGTASFWQGVDVPGSSLECVVITKLPFSSPADPLNAARIEHMRKKGLDAFNEYQLPQAVLMFKQGFGRLIRSSTDRGVVAVLDPRVSTRSYGREFIKALPHCSKTSDIEDVRGFFRS